MANSTITNLPAASTLTGAELIAGVQSASNVKITVTQLLGGASNNALLVCSSSGGNSKIQGATNLAWASNTLTIGATSVTGTLALVGSTSGTTNVVALAAAGGTLTLPNATDQLIARATTDTLTNKTYDTAGTGNVFKINGTQLTDVTGSGKAVLDTSPTIASPTITGTATFSGTNFAGVSVAVTAVNNTNTPYTALTTDFCLACTTSVSAVTVNLPASPSTNLSYYISDVGGNAGTNNITVSGNGHNIDGAATKVINTSYGGFGVFWTGSIWKTC